MMSRNLPNLAAFAFLVVLGGAAGAAEENDVSWLVRYDAKLLPDASWTPIGKPVARLDDECLTLSDDSTEDAAGFEASWNSELEGREIIVEARVKVVGMIGHRGSPVATWPQRDGAPICIVVSDGLHEEGMLLTPPAYKHPEAARGYVRTLTDRFHQADTVDDFHTYRLIIRGKDMAVEMDGRRVIAGEGAFWRPASSPRKFIRFGSTSKSFTAEAQWQYVRLGTRKFTGHTTPSPLQITLSEPWPLNVDKKNNETRPYLYDLGRGLLLMSNPQGSDALLEPYGVRRSTDAGRTWHLVTGLDQNVESPQELARLADGRILGPSRWTWLNSDGTLRGKTTILDERAASFTAYDSTISLPPEFMPSGKGEVVIFERNIWAEENGDVTAVAWTRLNSLRLPNGRTFPERRTHLLRSTDAGKTWQHFAHVGLGGEPAIVRLTKNEWLAVTRPDSHMSNLLQHRSLDGGRTWTFERMLEEGSVMPDLMRMSHGVLACSYGRPASNIMFSLDGGRTWGDHRTVSDVPGFNYTAIREIAPGRLLYMHDGAIPGTQARINSLYLDVKRAQ
jgi:hypothetical protein